MCSNESQPPIIKRQIQLTGYAMIMIIIVITCRYNKLIAAATPRRTGRLNFAVVCCLWYIHTCECVLCVHMFRWHLWNASFLHAYFIMTNPRSGISASLQITPLISCVAVSLSHCSPLFIRWKALQRLSRIQHLGKFRFRFRFRTYLSGGHGRLPAPENYLTNCILKTLLPDPMPMNVLYT